MIGLTKDKRSILDGDFRIADGPGDVALGRALFVAQIGSRRGSSTCRSSVWSRPTEPLEVITRSGSMSGKPMRKSLMVQPAIRRMKANLRILDERTTSDACLPFMSATS